MSRIKLKCGGKPRRKKAIWGEAINAAATLAAAGIQAAATANAAKTQAKSITENAKVQAQSLKQQSENNNKLQKEQINFTRQENQENRDQQNDIQMTLQAMAGQENMNSRMERSKMQLKYGGKTNKKQLDKVTPFKVTDGGGVIPVATTPEGYGLYEIYGNDHEHTHKAPGGKRKTGVGFKFNDGSVVEGEGNQNTNQGELLYIKPNDAMFISKHSIKGFNPTQAVLQGLHPEQAFAIQEGLKVDKRKTNKNKYALGGSNIIMNQANMTQNPSNGTVDIASGITYALNNMNDNQVQNNYRSIAKNGGRVKASAGVFWDTYGGATLTSAGNILGAGLNTFGSLYSANRLGKAYTQAGNILANAYSQMHGIDYDMVKRDNFEAPHTLAVVRQANTNINPQLERIRRNSVSQIRETNRSTLSSAARQQRLAAIQDKAMQQANEQYAYRDNENEKIKQENANRITQTADANAYRDVAARKDWKDSLVDVMKYNNDIENSKLIGMAEARANAINQSSTIKAQGLQNAVSSISSALTGVGQAFGTAHDNYIANREERHAWFSGLSDTEKFNYIMRGNDPQAARSYYNQLARIIANKNGSFGDTAIQNAKDEMEKIRNEYKNINFV